MATREHIAVVLFNLGGPDREGAIYPFLRNFFMDPAIIDLPYPIRFILARLIAWSRARGEARNNYAKLGFKSPLLENSEKQARALEDKLNSNPDGPRYSVHVCMRYWHPMTDAVVRSVKQAQATRVILLPLYPQFSTTTSGSSYNAWQSAAVRHGLDAPTDFICCYPTQDGFITAAAGQLRRTYEQICAQNPATKPPRVLFSAHGLPEKIIQNGDPYQSQCEATAAAVAAMTNIPNLDWQSCYQSRVGRLKWTQPSTEDAIRAAGRDQVPVIIYPHAFISEHVETLVEIEQEYRALARQCGVPAFARVETVMTDPKFIAGLAQIVRSRVTTPGGIASESGLRQCGTSHSQCPMKSCCRPGVGRDLDPQDRYRTNDVLRRAANA